MTSPPPSGAHNPADLVLAILNVTPRRNTDGTPVRIGAWNRAATDGILRALVDAGWLAPPAPAPACALPQLDDERLVAAAEILCSVAETFGLSVPVLTGPSRVRRVIRARQVALYLCRRLCDLSYPEIGRIFHRDHTTVLYAHNKIAGQLSSDPQLAGEVNGCMRALTAPRDSTQEAGVA